MTKITEERVWKKHFPKQSLSAQLPKMSIYAYLKHTNRDRLDAVALYYYGAKITHRQLIRRIDQCADAFHALGVTAGSTVSLLSGTTPESLISLYALNKLGAVVNCIDPRMDVQSIRRMICEANTRMLVTIDLAYPKVHQIRTVIGQKYIVVQSAATSLPPLKKLALRMAAKAPRIDYSDTVLSWESFLEKGKGTHAKEAAYQGDATVAITYTGGTTGFPKGVMLTNDSMNAVSVNFIHCGLVYEKGQRFLGIMPIFSSYGMVCGLHMPLTLGLELALIPRFVPAKMGALVKQFRPEHMIATPAFYEIMMNSKEVKDLDLSFIITMGSGGDTMNAGLEEKLHRFMREHNIRYQGVLDYIAEHNSDAQVIIVGLNNTMYGFQLALEESVKLNMGDYFNYVVEAANAFSAGLAASYEEMEVYFAEADAKDVEMIYDGLHNVLQGNDDLHANTYGMRCAFLCGQSKRMMQPMLDYCHKRLVCDRVPYAVEAYPEGGKRHLSGESALFVRIITEGMFGIRPESLSSFSFRPELPHGMQHAKLSSVHVCGACFDIALDTNGYRVTCGQKVIAQGPADGKRVTVCAK